MAQRDDYTAIASQTVFTYTFQIFEDSEIFVYQNGLLLTLTTDYTVSNNTLPSIGGTITLTTGATAGDAIALVQSIPITRLITYITDGDWKATTVNTDFDRIYTLLVQAFGTGSTPSSQISDRLIRFADSVNRTSATNLYPTPQDGYLLSWNSDGDIANVLASIATTDVQFLTLISQLKPLDVSTNTDAFCLGKVSALDGFQSRFTYDATSTATPDDEYVVKPDSVTLPDPGRWLAVRTTTEGIEEDAITTSKTADRAITVPKHGWIPLLWREGCEVTNGTDADHDIDITAGQIGDSTKTYLMECQAITKKIDETWAQGTNQGGLSDQDSLTADTWYGVFELHKSTDPYTAATSDAIFATTEANALSDTEASAAGYDIARLIDCVLTDSSSNILTYRKGGTNCRRWNDRIIQDPGGINVGSRELIKVGAPPFMPCRVVYAMSFLEDNGSPVMADVAGILTQTNQGDVTPTKSLHDVYMVGEDDGGNDYRSSSVNTVYIRVDENSQIYHREEYDVSALPPGLIIFSIYTVEWEMDFSITDLV